MEAAAEDGGSTEDRGVAKGWQRTPQKATRARGACGKGCGRWLLFDLHVLMMRMMRLCTVAQRGFGLATGEANKTWYAEQSTCVRLREGQPSGGNKQRCAEVRPQARECTCSPHSRGCQAQTDQTKGNTKTRNEANERPQEARVRGASAQAFGSPKPSPSHPARVVCPPYV